MSYERNRNTLINFIKDRLKYLKDEAIVFDLYFNDPKLGTLQGDEIFYLLEQFEKEGLLDIAREEALLYTPEITQLRIVITEIDNFLQLNTTEEIFTPTKNDSSYKYELTLSDKQELLINGEIPISKPHYGMDNFTLIEFLIKNPNQKFTKEELVKKLKLNNQNINFHKFIENLKFKGPLKDRFFSVSKNSILLRNPA